MYVCVCVYVTAKWIFSALYISKTNKNRNNKFCTQYETRPYMLVSGFEENQKTGSGIEQTGNETENEYLKNGSNDFLQIQ